MPTWKQINEVGGAVILRGVTGLLACGCLYGLVRSAVDGHLTLLDAGMLLLATLFFGGYAAVGNRMNLLVKWWK